MPEPLIDIVVVFSDDRARRPSALSFELDVEPDRVALWAIDDSADPKGVVKGANRGARLGSAPIIGFLHVDAVVEGDIVDAVRSALDLHNVVITGARLGRPQWVIEEMLGCSDWVSSAAMFVNRVFWTAVGGFDERFDSYHEADLIRRAQNIGLLARSIDLPIRCEPYPEDEADYKRFATKWRKA